MARKPKVIDASDDRLKLVEALKFAAIASKESEGKTEYVCFNGNQLSASNETFAIGVPIDIALELCPHAEQFKAAIQYCGQQFQLTQIETSAISIKSGNFRANIPAIAVELLTPVVPDPPVAMIDDRLKDCFVDCLRVMGKGERIHHTSVLLRSNTMCATNGSIAIERWHGIDLPTFNIPKKTAETISKISKQLVKFGFSNASATFYYDDGSFIKTRLIDGNWPDVDRLFSNTGNGPYAALWPEFWKGLEAIGAFVQGDACFFHDGFLASHSSLALGANYKIEGLPAGYIFSLSYLKAIAPFVQSIHLGAVNKPASFIGPNVRGLIVGRTA